MKNRRGFTIVELLIVVVVIAILAIIAITVFPGIQTRAQNSARSSLANSSVKLLELYRADNGRYPYIPASTGACLGTGYPNSRCRDSNTGGATSYLESTTVLSAVLSPYGVMNGGYVPVLGTGVPLLLGPTYLDGAEDKDLRFICQCLVKIHPYARMVLRVAHGTTQPLRY